MADIPLSPAGGGGMCIDTRALQKADIIVSTTSAVVSAVIRAGTGSAVSHSRLYIGDGEIIEAVGEGVMKTTLAAAIAHDTLAVAYRRKNVNDAAADAIVRFAMAQIGKDYDYGGALGGGARESPNLCRAVAGGWSSNILIKVAGIVACEAAARGAFSSTDKFYCSELVLEAFRQASLPIINGSPSTSTPKDIVTANSHGLLMYVGHIVA